MPTTEDAHGIARPVVAVRSLSKRFPGVQALVDVSIDFAAGEIHGLVGENGAGKSTLIRTIAGASVPDTGTVHVSGQALRLGDTRAQLEAGIAAIYQEPSVVPEMPVWSNVFLGRALRRRGMVARREMACRVTELAAELGAEIDPYARAGDLSIGQQQEIEIMRALEANHRVLILDEPTSSLGLVERTRLHETVRRLRDNGSAVIYVSHDLHEVLSLCDRVSVMRQGRLVATAPAADWSVESLVAQMLGRTLVRERRRTRERPGREIMRVEGLAVGSLLEGISFTLEEGEILGVAGLVGSGRTELLRALAGATPASAGRLWIDGAERPLPRSVRGALSLGIALLPEDRRAQGLVLSMTGRDNIVLSDLSAVSTGPLLRFHRVRDRARELGDSLHLDAGRLNGLVSTLSGGNQQKVVVAKLLHRGPRVLLMDEPTRGIDVGAKAEMLHTVGKLADEGMSVVMVSSELEEIVDTAVKVIVLANGRLQGVRPRGTSAETLLTLAFGLETA
jgi:ABC-type sugar transport system ATPase subunit